MLPSLIPTIAEASWVLAQGVSRAMADSTAAPDASSAGYTVIRFVMYTAMIGLAGSALFVLLLLRRLRALGLGSDQFAEDAAAGARRLGLIYATVLVLSTPARLIAQSVVLGVGAGTILGEQWGRAWMLQMAGAVAAVVAVYFARAIDVLRWRIAGLGAVAVAAGFSLSGHAASTEHYAWLAMLADVTHGVAAGAWIGTLAALALAGIPAALKAPEPSRGTIAAQLVGVFSPLALVSAGLLALTGTYAAWDHLGGLGALLHTSYGNALLRKLFFVAVVLTLGGVNWRILKPKLGTEEAARGIRRSALRELAVALVVLALTAVLVAMPTPEEMAQAAAAVPSFTTTLLIP